MFWCEFIRIRYEIHEELGIQRLVDQDHGWYHVDEKREGDVLG